MSFWICADEKPTVTHFYYFTKELDIPAGARLTARTCGDTRYHLYLNDRLVCEGPCQGSQYVRYYEDTDLTPYLQAGKNTLCAKVMYMQEGSFISVYRGSRPAFWLDGTLTLPDGTVSPVGTDETWHCLRDDSVSFHHQPGIHTSVPPCEEVQARQVLTPVPTARMYEPNLQNKGYNIFGLGEYYPLSPRPIPPMQTGEPKTFQPVRRGEGWLELDAGTYTTARVSLTFRAAAGSTVRVIYSECYTQEDGNGNRYKGRRDDASQPTSGLPGVADILHASGETQTYSPFWYRAFRFIRLEFDPEADFTLLSLTYQPYFYPLDSAGQFACSDDRFNRMWDISRNTVLCCMHEMYVDCPFYEQQQYDMDSCLEMLFTFRMSADRRMPLKSITDLAHSQLSDGMLQANYPSTMVQVIPGFTLFWVLMLREYLRYTGSDPACVAEAKTFSGILDRALEAFEPYMTKDGLIGPTPYWPFVDWVPAWPVGVPVGGREEPITVTCLMFAAALKAASEMAETFGRPERAAEYDRRAGEMIRQVNRLCYDEEAGLYRDTPSRRNFSQHTSLWAVLSGAVTGEEAGALIDRTFDGHVPVSACTFSMNHYLFRALEAAGRYRYAPVLFEGWQKMLDLHCTTWCENPDSPRSECHGWSSAPIYEFSEMVLGVYPTADGYRRVRVKPWVEGLGLTWAKGTVPTPYGVLSVAWEIENRHLTLTVTRPAGADMEVTLILPDGQAQVMEKDTVTATVSCKL